MDKKNIIKPIVSVGIPTYERPNKLKRTLECITRQTYNNLEIIISDNNSQDPKVDEFVNTFRKRDSRIRYFKQSENKGMINNSKFVLEKANGKYFMWAADDDEWSNVFIEKTVEFLQDNSSYYVAAITESQYKVNNKPCEFFREGVPFYSFNSPDKMIRLYHIIRYNFGNLFYSLFDREIIQAVGRIFFENLQKSNISFTEIPLFILIIEHGNWKVLPSIGIYKETNLNAYKQARWEMTGGDLPLSYYRRLIKIFKYHLKTIQAIFLTINRLKLSFKQKSTLKLYSFLSVMKHFFHLIIRRKKKSF